jgi:hypothetical protein
MITEPRDILGGLSAELFALLKSSFKNKNAAALEIHCAGRSAERGRALWQKCPAKMMLRASSGWRVPLPMQSVR